MLAAFDGLKTYINAFRRVFRDPVRAGRRGRPRLAPWPDVALVQVIKHYVQGRVAEVEQRIVQGLPTLVARLLIELMNAAFRQCLTWLTRRTRTLAHRPDILTHAMFLLGTVYHFCRFHVMLSFPDRYPRTPAMAAGLTDHRWTMLEFLSFRVPPPPFVPPRKRGRKPKAVLVEVAA